MRRPWSWSGPAVLVAGIVLRFAAEPVTTTRVSTGPDRVFVTHDEALFGALRETALALILLGIVLTAIAFHEYLVRERDRRA